MWLAQMVVRSASRLVKLCTGVLSAVCLRACFGQRSVGALGCGNGIGAFSGRGGFVVVVKQDRGQDLVHVPADVVGQHPREHMGADPVGEPMADGAHVEFGVEGAEEPFDVFEALVPQHHVVVVEGVGGQAGAQHVDAVEGGLGGDRLLVAGEREGVLGDGESEVFAHLVMARAHRRQP